jgi:glycerol-3-phosphate dehydrogenase
VIDSSGIKPFDVAIIGGGINGCGAAADAAMRGLSVILCEKGDLASQTSSSSSKLIHGGLRYLDQFNFSLVRKALKERQTLLTIAPHLVRPLSFILPQGKNSRPLWVLRLGLFIYDHLSRSNRLLKSNVVKRGQKPDYFKPLLNSINQGVLYYDCRVDDARLTIVNALQAKAHGAKILTQTDVMHATIVDGIWHLTVQTENQDPYLIKAKSIINATGPWVESVNEVLNIPNKQKISLVKGSHLVLEKLYEGDHAYVLQHDDKRIVFTIPYFGQTLVGTTDIPWSGLPQQLTISTLETDYLLDLVASYFGKRPKLHQIITSFSGVRPLLFEPGKNASSLTRDYLYHYTAHPAPCITIYGGKITTYRILAKEVIDTLRPLFPLLPGSNSNITPLPGAMLGTQSIQDYGSNAQILYPWLPEAILNHYLQTYGTRTDIILKGCTHLDALGEHFGGVLYQREVDYLVNEEWATTVDDILWRRTKLGFNLSKEETTRLSQYVLRVC